MASKGERISTSEPSANATYQIAEGIRVGVQISKPAMTQQVRTVATSAKSGSIDLRYAPHSPKTKDINTSS
jgi:hypothetical protein